MNICTHKILLTASQPTIAPCFRLLVPLLVLLLLGVAPAQAGSKKFIELGWDIPHTGFLREHWKKMEQEGPFDGVMFRVQANSDTGQLVSTFTVWNPSPWKKEWFGQALTDLKACHFKQYRHNFLLFNANPKRLAWTDDRGWEALAGKLRICAWLAREGKAKGLALDCEPYGENQWRYDPATHLSFAETSKLARMRGAQLVQNIALEMPQAVLLTLFLNSALINTARKDLPQYLLPQEPYGLLPAFFTGMLDAAPPGMLFVDGCESSYRYQNIETYHRAALDIRAWHGPCISLIAPERQEKYRRQVQAGFALYLDMFINKPGHAYYHPPLDDSRLKRLTYNLQAARDAADEYVWLYGEQSRWWSGLAQKGPWRQERLKQTVGKGRSWEEALPGITATINRARAPETAARKELSQLQVTNQARNLVKNPYFRKGPHPHTMLPKGWRSWQHESLAKGTISWDPLIGKGSAKVTGVQNGCLLQKIAVRPGRFLAVEASSRIKGATVALLTVRWQTAQKQWLHTAYDRSFPFHTGSGPWKTAFGGLTAPPESGFLVLLLTVQGQTSAQDVCWFDNVQVYSLDNP